MSYAKRIRLTDAIRDKLGRRLSRIRINGEFGPERHGELARSVIEEYADAEAVWRQFTRRSTLLLLIRRPYP